VDVAALQEIWRKETEMVNLKDYIMINSGSKDNILGTGFTIKNTIKAIMNYTAVNERICRVRLKGRYFNISIHSVHAPTEEKEEEDKC
jgi:hypothetical protein